MYKLVVSPKRYSALLHASHLLDYKSVVIVISDGMEEYTPYPFCREALRIQKKFELEKAFKVMGVSKLYMMNQDMNDINYEIVAIKLQLLIATQPFTHLYYINNGDQRLVTVCNAIKGNIEKLVYKPKGKEKWLYTLSPDELELKLTAIEKMVTIRRELLAYSMENEYVQKG